MIAVRDQRFDDEARRFELRFTCETCVHFDDEAQRCHHGWPTGPHRAARYRPSRRPGDDVIFCKEFELR